MLGFHNLLLKHTFSTNRDNYSQVVRFYMSKSSFSEIESQFHFFTKCSRSALFTKGWMRYLFKRKDFEQWMGRFSPRHEIHIDWSKSSVDLSIYPSFFKLLHSFSERWSALRSMIVDSLLSGDGWLGTDQPQSFILWQKCPARTTVHCDHGMSYLVHSETCFEQ
jgi:hypothetical protein